MSPAAVSFLPDALPPIPERHAGRVRALWLVLFLAAVAVQLAAVGYFLLDRYRIAPAFAAVGLTATTMDDRVTVVAIEPQARRPAIVEGSRLVAIGATPVPVSATQRAIARTLAAAGPRVVLTLRDGHGVLHRITVDHRAGAAPRSRPDALSPAGVGVAVLTALGTIVLFVSAALLARRRAEEPVALLLSIAFLVMTTTYTGALPMWRDLHLMAFPEWLGALWWMLLAIALAGFPDGRFEPRPLRWILVIAPLFAIVLHFEELPNSVTLLLGVVPPLVILASQIVRYRRYGPGIERQQLKWAAFGFLVGFFALGVVTILIDLEASAAPGPAAWLRLGILGAFTLSFIAMPLGLLVSLLRYRLWEADRVISRSIAYAAVTVVVGIVWAASSDIVKQLVANMLGGDSTALATTLSALIAVGIFTPSQAIVLRWTKARFGQKTNLLRALPARLELWRDTESPAELGMRALAAIAAGVHCSGAALMAL